MSGEPVHDKMPHDAIEQFTAARRRFEADLERLGAEPDKLVARADTDGGLNVSDLARLEELHRQRQRLFNQLQSDEEALIKTLLKSVKVPPLQIRRDNHN